MGYELSAVVVTFNSAHVIEDLLDSLPAALGDVTAEVVVVDNGSTDETVERLARRGDCQVVTSFNSGYAGGVNRGARVAQPMVPILVLNPDVRLGANSIPRMLETLQLPGTGIVAPQVRSAQGALEYSLRREPTLLRAVGLNGTKVAAFSEYVNRPDEYASAHVVDWALGAVLLISHECFEALGGWDESFFLYSEETDFCLRARDLGYHTRYQPDALAVHIGGQSGQSDKTHTMQAVNRVRLYRRRHGVVGSWMYFWLTVASELRWAARGQRESLPAIRALVRPSRRPAEIGASTGVMPR